MAPMWNLAFTAPQVIEARVLTRLPDSFRRKRRTEWADANKPGHEIDSFLEGPSFDREGKSLRHRHPLRPHLSHLARARVDPGLRIRRLAQRHRDPSRRIALDCRLPAWPPASPRVERARFPSLPSQQRILQRPQRPDLRRAGPVYTSPTRARRACTIRPAAFTGCVVRSAGLASCRMYRAPMASRSTRPARCSSWP
jgi:hypothetical protein